MVTEALRPAAGYVRESTKMQRKGYGADVQREGIHTYAPTVGYDIAMCPDDTAKGRIVDRPGYQAVIAAAKAGTIEAVIVYMFDRAGRDGVEFVQFAHELERLRVPLYSVTQGKLAGDGMSFIHAFMAENEVRTLARRVRPAKERSVRAGQHIGTTPFGYKRVYPEHEGASRYIPGLLVADEPAAGVVRELFARAAVGWSVRDLALWLNASALDLCPSHTTVWTTGRVSYILANPVYYGSIRYNVHGVGYYDHCEPGSAFIAQGRHEPLIARELFDRVRERLDASGKHCVRTHSAHATPLAAGMLYCVDCGAPMTTARRVGDTREGRYVCGRRLAGGGPCDGAGYLIRLAHDALLAQVARLQGCPWQPQALERVLEADPTADERARLQAGLRDARSEQTRHVRRFTALVDDPTEAEVAVHRQVGREIQARVDALEAALASLPVVDVTARDLQAIHRELTQVALGDVVGRLSAIGDDIGLRALLLKLVDQAVIVDRAPAKRSSWLRAAVTWAPKVQLLVNEGLLSLAPDVERPDIPNDPVELRRVRQRAYHVRKKGNAIL